jgi:hypothetical protein
MLMWGVALMVLGLVAAVTGILGVGERPVVDSASGQWPMTDSIWDVALPIFSGLLLSVGALLIGLSMGNWRHPRSWPKPGDAIVDPEGHHTMKHV